MSYFRTSSAHHSGRGLGNAGPHLPDRHTREAATRAGIECSEKFGCEICAAANLRSQPARGLRRKQDQDQGPQLGGFRPSEKRHEQNTTADCLTLSRLLLSLPSRKE